MNYFLDALGKYAVFSGRARRSEYWYFVLFSTLLVILFYALGLSVAKASGGPTTIAEYFVDLLSLLLLLPSLAVSVRRLHDIGMSGWWVLLNFVPFGGLVLIFFFARDGQPGPNIYGPNPKEVPALSV